MAGGVIRLPLFGALKKRQQHECAVVCAGIQFHREGGVAVYDFFCEFMAPASKRTFSSSSMFLPRTFVEALVA